MLSTTPTRKLNILKSIGNTPGLLNTNENMLPTIFDMPTEWTYRGEGNDSVVISLPKIGKILRIKKTARPKSIFEWLIIWISDILYWYLGKGVEDEIRDLKFYSTVMRRLLGTKYTSEAKQVILTKKQVKILESDLGKYRPDFRKLKILQYGRSTLYEDFALLPEDEYGCLPFKVAENTFAIEIKPKQGWRPMRQRNFPKCIYCMNQYLKLANKKVSAISRYCPQDLFSGDTIRMNYAIKSLTETPQNNLRIFKNGNLVYGDKLEQNFHKILQQFFNNKVDELKSLETAFYDLIRKCLLTNMMNVDFAQNCEEQLFCEWNKIIQQSCSKDLPRGCVLEKILSIQMLDSEGSEYYSKLLNKQNLKDWEYVELLLGKISRNTCLNCTVMMLGDIGEKDENIEMKFIPYMISAIANDCSLMIAFKKIDEDVSDDLGMKNIMETPLGHFVVNIGVFDLTPKPLSAIRRHCRRNKDILQAYNKATKPK